MLRYPKTVLASHPSNIDPTSPQPTSKASLPQQISQRWRLMGECVSKNNPVNQSNARMLSLHPKATSLGITQESSNQNSIRFSHSPLSSSEFLAGKFSSNSASPEEVNLSFMLLRANIDALQNVASLAVVHQNEINVYLVLGGVELVSSTGLTVSISKIKYLEKLTLTKPSPRDPEELTVVPAKMGNEPIFIILEPVLKNGQTMFIINRYANSQTDKTYRRKSQTLQWCSLAFDLQEIYGSDNLFKCDSGEQCAVCLTNPSNVILTPCRHMCMCMDCSKTYQKTSKKCPICRTEFRATIGYN